MPVEVKEKTPNGAALLSNGNVVTPVARVSFPNLFRPRKQGKDANAKEKYSVSLLFKKDEDLTVLKKAVAAVLADKFGSDKEKWPKKLKLPFLDQGEQEYEGYEKGCLFIRCNSDQKPGVVNGRNQYVTDEAEVYPGCYGRATVRAFYYDNSGNKGVSFGLQNFQKTGDGEPLGGRMKAEDEFTPVDGDDPFADKPAAEDPLAGMGA